MLILFNYFFSEVVLGEFEVGKDPDCAGNKCNPRAIKRGIRTLIVHENYNKKSFANDISLIRLDRAVPLYQENPDISGAKPICLPWKQNDYGRVIENVFRYGNCYFQKKIIICGITWFLGDFLDDPPWSLARWGLIYFRGFPI